ncbi:MAG: hypothetical protein Q9188_002802 [Gyalolechia gomerana]
MKALVTHEELEYYLTKVPIENIQLAGEHEKKRKATITIDEVRFSSPVVLDALFKAWTQLGHIFAQHQTVLSKRWLKKSSKQRREILSNAWPGMPEMHRPDFEKDSALRFPYINLEDLSQPKPLLLMIVSRSQNCPSIFTNADAQSIRVGIRSEMIILKYVRGYAMYLNRERTREGYGRLVSWEENHCEALQKCIQGIELDPGMGPMILEIQRDLLQFLVRCSEAILHDIPLVDIPKLSTSSSTDPLRPQHQPRPGAENSRSRTNSLEYGSFAAFTSESLYRAPDAYDFTRLRSLVQAKYREAKDHFFLIHGGPVYFADLMHEACGHSMEAIMNPRYNSNYTQFSEAAWDEALFNVLQKTDHDVFLWDSISSLVDVLISTYAMHKANIQPGQFLPNAYKEGFSGLGMSLMTVNNGYLAGPGACMSAMPSFRRQIVTKESSDGQYTSLLTKKPDDQFDIWLRRRIAPYYEIEEVLFKGIGLALLVKDLRVFDYPSDKLRVATTIAKMRSAEQALDMTKGDEEKATQDLDVSFALRTLEERTESTIDQTQQAAPRQKSKTRGPSSCPTYPAREEPTAETVEDTPPSPTLRVAVKKKAFSTFAALFGRPVADKLPGELPWTDFKQAMIYVGFSSEKLQASAWLFSSGLRSIVFHEPHPERKLPMQWARLIARRLNCNFGWTAESFVPEKGCG